MKKNVLMTGFMYLIVGILFLLGALFLETRLDSLFWGFAGAGIIPGLVMICRYFYWANPKNSTKYLEKVENEEINLYDERKEKFRNQSGRYSYVIGLITICISILIFSLLYFLDIMENAKPLILYLGGYAVFQYILGVIIFKYLDKRY